MKKFFLSFLALMLLLTITIGLLELCSSYTVAETINRKAPVQTMQQIIIKASPEKVYAIMSDVNKWSSWQSDIHEPSLKNAFQKGSSFDWKSGGLNIHSTIHTAIPSAKIGWSGKTFGAFAIHNWILTPGQDQTIVTVEESMEGWLVKLMRKKFQTGLEQSLHVWLHNLKVEAEKKD